MTSQELTIRDQTQQAIDYFRAPEVLEQVRYALPENESPHKFVRTLSTALMENQDLVLADRNSLITAVFKCAQMNLLPDGREAVINVYNTKVKIDGKDVWIKKATLIPMVDGYAKNVAEYGWSLVADVVYENDTFDPGSTEKPLFHSRARLGTDRGKPIGAYALAMHRTLGFRQEIFTEEQINEVRKTSKQPDGQLWTKWWDRAWRKTLAKQVAKRLPLSSTDKEPLHALLNDDTNGEQATELLYGDRPALTPAPTVQAGTDPPADKAGEPVGRIPGSPPANVNPVTGEIHDEDLPEFGEPEFVGEEPNDDHVEAEAFEVPTFGGKKHAGKTVQEVWDEGDHNYVRWARQNWKTGPIVAALEAFAQEHPEIDAHD